MRKIEKVVLRRITITLLTKFKPVTASIDGPRSVQTELWYFTARTTSQVKCYISSTLSMAVESHIRKKERENEQSPLRGLLKLIAEVR